MKPISLGIIGCGVIGKQHAAAASKTENVKLIAVADFIPDTAKQLADEYNIPKTYTDGQKLLGDPDIDAVIIALPTSGRLPLVLEALKQHKHVLTEKPVAMNAADVQTMIAAQGDLTAGCCSSRFQYYPHTIAAAKAIADDKLGNIRVMHIRCLNSTSQKSEKPPIPWRLKMSANGGGFLVNWGVYDLDYFMTLTNWTLKPKTVLAQTWQAPEVFQNRVAPGSDAETHFIATILCESGTIIHIERGETTTTASETAWKIVGDKASLDLQMTPSNDKKITLHSADPETGVTPEIIWQGNEDWDTASTGLAKDFADAIQQKRPPATCLKKALLIQKICDAIYKSANTGRAVDLM